MPWAAASSGAWSMSRNTIALAPSGGSGASQPCSAASTRSAGTIASAGPPLPWPSSTDTVGVSSVTSSARQLAISPARPPCSASADSAGPAVSITSTSGSCSPAASAMPRRASRSAAGPDQAADDALLAEHDRGLAAEPGQRQQRRRGLAAARCRTAAPVRWCRAAAGARRRAGPAVATPPPTPRRARRATARPAAPAAAARARRRPPSARGPACRAARSSGTTPSMTPCRCRFSAV